MEAAGIEAFLAIVQTGSLNKAAALLNLSQGAVSYRLKVLEQNMGTRLVERSKGIHKVQLTPMGESFFNLAERWNLLQQEMQILQAAGPQLSLSISAADSLNLYVLPPLYRVLRQHVPLLRLRIRTHHTGESFDSIERKEMDVAFVVRESVSPSVTVKPFYTEEMVLLRLADASRIPGEVIDIRTLEPQHELYMNWSTDYQPWHDRWWDPICPSRTYLDTVGLIAMLMQEEAQWAIVPLSVGSHLIRTGKFVLERLSEPAPERICDRVTHKYPHQSARKSLKIRSRYEQMVYAGAPVNKTGAK